MYSFDDKIKNFDFEDESFISFLKRIPAAVAVLDTQIRYIAVSDRWISDYGLENQDIIGKCHYEIFPEILDMPEWLAYHQSSLKGAVHQVDEDSFPRADGRLQWIRWKIYPWYSKPQQVGGMIFYTEVITEQKEKQLSLEKANKELSSALEELQHKNQQLEEFAYITAHNLRSSTTNLAALTKLYGVTEESRVKENVIHQISTSTQTLINTLDDLQESLVIQTHTDIPKDLIRFEEVCVATVEQMEALLEECQAHIETDFSQAATVSFPKSYMESIFTNLVSNAIKYRSPERILHLKIGSYLKNNRVHLYFQDNGLGIDLIKHQKKLFKMGRTFHRKKDARGIGLFLIKSQIEALKGDIEVASEVNKGTTFTVIFNK